MPRWQAKRALAQRHLAPDAVAAAGLLDPQGVAALIKLHEAPDTSAATQTQLDAVINHMIGVQILHERFVAGDIPAEARRKAQQLGWRP